MLLELEKYINDLVYVLKDVSTLEDLEKVWMRGVVFGVW